MAKVDLTKLTAHQQIAVLRTLTQQAAAFLIGMSARALRDNPNVPRATDDGRYDAKGLFKWWSGRIGTCKLNDEDLERAMILADDVGYGQWRGVRLLRELQEKHGSAGLAAVSEIFLETWIEPGDQDPGQEARPTETELRGAAQRAIHELKQQAARDRLEIAIVCCRCGKLRCGRRWVKAKPRAGYFVKKSWCPACEAKEEV